MLGWILKQKPTDLRSNGVMTAKVEESPTNIVAGNDVTY